MASLSVIGTITIGLVGCGATQGLGTGGTPDLPDSSSPGWITPTACWLPGFGLASCGTLVSVDGQMPDGQAVDMTGAYYLSSPGLGNDGLINLWLDRNDSCKAQSFFVAVQIDGNELFPDTSQMSGPLIACVPSDGVDYSWFLDMFTNPMRITLIDSQTVRITSADAGNPAHVDFQWA